MARTHPNSDRNKVHILETGITEEALFMKLEVAFGKKHYPVKIVNSTFKSKCVAGFFKKTFLSGFGFIGSVSTLRCSECGIPYSVLILFFQTKISRGVVVVVCLSSNFPMGLFLVS